MRCHGFGLGWGWFAKDFQNGFAANEGFGVQPVLTGTFQNGFSNLNTASKAENRKLWIVLKVMTWTRDQGSEACLTAVVFPTCLGPMTICRNCGISRRPMTHSPTLSRSNSMATAFPKHPDYQTLLND
jgi:hypothetical protein